MTDNLASERREAGRAAIMDLERKLGDARRAKLNAWRDSHAGHAHVNGLMTVEACRDCDHASAIHEANRRKGETIGNAVKRATLGPAMSVYADGGAGHCAVCHGQLDYSYLVRFDGGTVEQRCSLHVPEVKPDLRIWNVERAWLVAHAEKSDRDANAAARNAKRTPISLEAALTASEALRRGANPAYQRVIDTLVYGSYAGISVADAEILAYAERLARTIADLRAQLRA